jgi:hypothetical protein
MKSTLQTITSPHTGSSKITLPTSNRKWFCKYFKQLALFAVMLTAGVQVALADPDPYFPSGGDGSENNPFQIKTVDDLVQFGSMALVSNAGSSDWENTYRYKSYKLMNDITLTGTNNYWPAGYRTSTGSGYTYNSFQGVFDGNNCTISGISITTRSIQFSGFISVLRNGIVKDLTIASSTFKTTYNNSCVGAIAGYLEGSAQIINCKIIDCTIDGNNCVGGIVGGTSSASPAPTIQNCRVGGTTNIKHTNSEYYGAIVGRNLASTGSWSNNYYEWTVTKNDNPMRYNGTGWACNGYNIYGKAEIEPVNSWAALKRAMSVGVTGDGVITLAGDCTDPSPSSTSYLEVPSNKTVVLNLNGKTINRNLTTAINDGYVIYNRGTLTINGSGTITGGKNTGAGGGIYDYGTLTINGGSITGNTASNGGGIFEYYHTTNTTINGVSITENSATNEGGGIYVSIPISNTNTITICGGSTISNNSAVKKGGGISYVEGTLKIKGKVTISGNTKGEDPNNVELYSGKKITIDDNLDSDTRIGVYVQDITSFPRYITSGLSGKGVYSYFTSDNATYAVRSYDDNNAEACLKRIISPTVSMSGWAYGSSASSPSVSGNTGNGTVTYTYKAEGGNEFTSTKPTNAGTHTVKATIAETSGYTGSEATTTYIVAQREAILSWENTSLTYNKSAQKPTASVSNKVGSDVCDVTVDGAQANAGNYTATATDLSNSNYKLPAVKTQTFTIAKKDVTVSNITASNKTYDGNTTATIVATNASFDGLLDGDALSVSTSGTFADANVGTGKTVTFGALTLGGTSVGNYQLKTGEGVQQSSTTADITAKALTITADGKNITYGDEPPTYTVSSDGFVAGESEANLTGTISCACDYAQYNNANTYPITPSGATSTNYAITYTPGTLTVAQKEVGLSWSTDSPFTYDGQSHCLTATATGMVNSDEIGVTVTGAQTSAGDSYTATASELTGTKSGNYKLPAANTQPFTINKRAVTVTPSDGQSKTYGDSDPTITYNVDGLLGLVPGESLSGTLERAAGEDVNTYAITQGTVTNENNGNYNITFTTGKTFAITPKTIGISWGPTILTYNSSAQAPTATATGLVGSDVCNLSVTGQQTAVGVYTITDAPATVTALDNTNYQLPTTGLTTGFEIVNPLSISFAANQTWATWYGGYNYEVPAGMTAYKVISVSGSTVTVDAITYVPANTGVLIKRTATEAAVANSNVYNGETSVITSLLRNGNPTPYIDYILYNDGFVLSSVSTLGDHRCYLPASGAAATRGLTIEIGDGTTDIAPKVVEEIDTGEWYDLQGRRIEKPQKKGLYIRDGKKIVVK